MGWVVNATPRSLYPREIHGTHCIGGWVAPRAGIDGCEKSHPHRDSIPGPTSPLLVAIPTELTRSTENKDTIVIKMRINHPRVLNAT